MAKFFVWFVWLLCVGCLFNSGDLFAHDNDGKSVANTLPAGSGGSSDGVFESHNVVLLGHLELDQMGGGGNVTGNDCWGWTDPDSGRKFALMGLTNGASFVEVTDPTNPLYLGKLDTTEPGQNRAWRDIKVHNHHAFIVADGGGNDQGIQTFDLTQLLTVDPASPQSFTATSVYLEFSPSHNVVINEATGHGFVVGARLSDNSRYHRGGLVIMDFNDPLNITEIGSFSADGYTHDAQALIYAGPDADYLGDEIVFACNEDTLTIVKVAEGENGAVTTSQISRNPYSDANYAHQGWLSPDQKYFYMDDELDEYNHARGPDGQFGTDDDGDPIPTKTHIWNVEDLDNPVYEGFYQGAERTIDHNLYTKDNFIYQGNYTSGMRILQIDPDDPTSLSEFGFFDSYPVDNGVSFGGVWSVYPYFDYGDDDIILISDRQGGLFMVRRLPIPTVETLEVNAAEDQRSAVESLSLVFDGSIVFEDGAISVVQRSSATTETFEPVTINVSEAFADGQTTATILFASHIRNTDGVLVDGNYQLTLNAAFVTRDGVPMSQDFVFGAEKEDGFFCYYGDANGDRSVNAVDLLPFRKSYRAFTGDPNYNDALDFDAGGLVNALDLLQFRIRYGKTLPFVFGSSSASRSFDAGDSRSKPISGGGATKSN